MTLLATAGLAGDSGPFPASVQSRSAPPRSGIELVDEPLGSSDQPEFEPAGAGTEASTSQQSFQTLLEFEPDRDQTFMLEEIAVSIESNGQAQVGVNGQVYGPYDGSVDISLPFGGATMPYGGLVRVQHQSTNGNSTTTKASVTGREV